ncbi:hypothetical protein [Pseudomonas migulae]|jgi:hypothetical protein|uniref:Uncharacterized protein n=1 Tax=Pseudomonas migulae TaxID=78543 RepID=A0A1H5L4C2_9PSED|nr:hypothetical protein [Pseudomonas migulae]SEE71078.1 hypothetical protein SAMN04490194_3652 [Pseudomonas migulae]
MSHYLKAPEVVVLIDEKSYRINTPSCFNNTTKSGDEIACYSYAGGQKITIVSRVVETAGDGLSTTVEWDDKVLGSPVVLGYRCESKNEKSESECAVVPHIPS